MSQACILATKPTLILRFKGHDMLAPFTAGWQTSDLNPLVIAKSEVRIVELFSFECHIKAYETQKLVNENVRIRA